jgi:hypothetical protein
MTAKQPTPRQQEYLELRADANYKEITKRFPHGAALSRIINNCVEFGWLTGIDETDEPFKVTPLGLEIIGRRGSAVAAAIIAGDDAYIDGALERVDAELAAVGYDQPDAMPGPTEVVAELDPWHPDRSACISGRVFALTRGLKATPTDSRYRMRAARVGSRVVDLHSDAGNYLATIVEHADADWRVADREREVGAYGSFAAAVQAVRTMATNGEITGRPDPYAEPPAAAVDPLATLRAASGRFEAACESGVDVDDHARDLAIALGAAARDVLAEAIAATLADGRITPATDHPVTVEGPDSAGHISVSCTQCPASATGLEDVLEAVVSALTHGPLAAAFDFAALADQFTRELEADDLEELTEMTSAALTGPRDAHVNQAATDLVDTLKVARPLKRPTAD